MNNLKQYLKDKILTYGDNTAIKYEDKKLSYSQLNNISSSLSNILKNNNINNNIAIYGKKDIFKYIAVLSIVYADKTYVPLNEKNSNDKTTSIIINSNINTIITTKENIDFIKKTFPQIVNIITLDENNKFDIVSIIEDDRLSLDSGSTLAYILFTSGTTGEPKGVKISKDNLLSYIKTKQKIYNFEERLNFSQIAQLSFDISTFEIFICWSSGGVLHLITDEDILCPSDYIIENNINVWYSVPTFAINMNKLEVLEDNSLPSLRFSFFCGEPMPKDTAIQWLKSAPNTILDNLYGPTEATVDVTRYRFAKHDFDKKFYNDILPIGKPIDAQEIIIVDKDYNKITKQDNIGEILISGTQLSSGYLNNSTKDKELFISYDFGNGLNKYYKSGDLAFYNDNMNLEFHSRKDTQIKIGGKRVEIGEIEYIFKSSNLINDIIIVPRKDKNGRVVELVAFILEQLDKSSIQTMQKKAMRLLDKLFIPKQFIYIEEYPKTISDKIDRSHLLNLRIYNPHY